MKLQDVNLQVDFASEGQEKARLEQAAKIAATAYEKAKAEMALVAEQVFQLYSMLIAEKARQPWTKIVQEQVEAAPWNDLQDVEHAEQSAKSWDTLLECMRFHLLTIFHNNATETKRYYISNCLKKPNKVCIHQFVQCMMQLKNYIKDLPCLFYSPNMSMQTQKVYSFTEAKRACNIFCICPLAGPVPLTETCCPEGVKPLLLILDHIEVAYPVDEKHATAKPAKPQGIEQPSKKFTQGARIPRKPKHVHSENARVEKICDGGMQITHNTAECHRYKKDGTPTQGTTSHQGKNSGNDRNSKKSFAQVIARMEKLEKSLKKASKRGKKCRRHEESDKTRTLLEVLGQVVSRKTLFVVRNLKLRVN